MARVYHRDSNGRFASGGGGSSGGGKSGGGKGKAKAAPKSKAGATRAANNATTKRLLGKGMLGTGSRLRTSTRKLYSGSKATKERQERLWNGAESNQRVGAYGEKGAQRSKAKVRGTVSRKR